MSKWEITWRDGFVEGFQTADDSEVLAAVSWLLSQYRSDPVTKIEIVRKS